MRSPTKLSNEQALVHHAPRQRGGGLAARGARAAGRPRAGIGVLAPYDENDPEGKLRYSTFTQALAALGWTDGRNVRIDLRWYGDGNRIRALAQELVDLQPDIILTWGSPGDRRRPARDADDSGRLYKCERSRRQRHRRTA